MMKPSLILALSAFAVVAVGQLPTRSGNVVVADTAAPSRVVYMNGARLGRQQLELLSALEQQYGRRLSDGAYWYDSFSGLAGAWNGPAAALLPAGLGFPGPLPAAASGGRTRVFVNGRALHPVDLQALARLLGGPIPAGRYWLDSSGNAGAMGEPASVNLIARSRQRAPRRGYQRQVDNIGGSGSYVGSDGQTSYFFDGASGCSVIPGGGVSC